MKRKNYIPIVSICSFLAIACVMGGNYYCNYKHFKDMKDYLKDKKVVEEVKQDPITVFVEREDRPYINYRNLQLR